MNAQQRIAFLLVTLVIGAAVLTSRNAEQSAVLSAESRAAGARAESELADLAARLHGLRGLRASAGEAGFRLVLHDWVDPWGREYLADLSRGVVMHCGADGRRGSSRPGEVPDGWAYLPEHSGPPLADADLCPEPGQDDASWLRDKGLGGLQSAAAADAEEPLIREVNSATPPGRASTMEIETTLVLIR